MKYATIIMWLIAVTLFIILYKQGREFSLKGLSEG